MLLPGGVYCTTCTRIGSSVSTCSRNRCMILVSFIPPTHPLHGFKPLDGRDGMVCDQTLHLRNPARQQVKDFSSDSLQPPNHSSRQIPGCQDWSVSACRLHFPSVRSSVSFDRLATLDGSHPDRPKPSNQDDRSRREIRQLEGKQSSVPRQVQQHERSDGNVL